MTMKQALRWVAVVPGSILGGIAVLFPVHWLAMMFHAYGTPGGSFITTTDGKDWLQAVPLESIEGFGDALLVPGTIVAIGARIAPRFHLTTAIVLTLLYVALMTYMWMGLSRFGMYVSDSPLRTAINAALWVVSLVCAILYARDLDKGIG